MAVIRWGEEFHTNSTLPYQPKLRVRMSDTIRGWQLHHLKSEIRNPKPEIRNQAVPEGDSPFNRGLPVPNGSDFGLRISDFKKCTCQPQMV
jgi:hypothetical protein